MANKHKGEVSISFDRWPSKTFVLRFTTNAYAEFEDAYGKSLVEAMEDLEAGKIGPKFIRAGLYAGLLADPQIGRSLTKNKAGDLITPENETEIALAVIKAMLLSRGVDPDALKEKDEELTELVDGDEGNAQEPQA